MAAAFCALGWLVTGCATEKGMDLADNPALYRNTGYETTLPADRSVFLLPVVDDREVATAEAAGPYTVSYFADGDWERPPAVMVDEILRREIVDSGVFSSLSQTARPEDCLLRVKLKRFEVGAESHVTGWKSFAAIVLSVEVLGPLAPNGERPRWMDRDFGGAQKSSVGWVPPPATTLTGQSLRQAITQMLAALDQSNVARANVPLDLEDK